MSLLREGIRELHWMDPSVTVRGQNPATQHLPASTTCTGVREASREERSAVSTPFTDGEMEAQRESTSAASTAR